MIQSGVVKKRSEVGKLEADVKFLKVQLDSTQQRLPVLQAQFDKANLATLECNTEGACTVAEKEVRVLISQNAAEAVQNINRDIERYKAKIDEKEALHLALKTSYEELLAKTQP